MARTLLLVATAPPAPDATAIRANAAQAIFRGEFRRNLKGSDMLHWGEGIVAVSPRAVSLQGSVSPGFNHKLFLSPEFIETKDDFVRLRKDMVPIGDVTTFENFLVRHTSIPPPSIPQLSGARGSDDSLRPRSTVDVLAVARRRRGSGIWTFPGAQIRRPYPLHRKVRCGTPASMADS